MLTVADLLRGAPAADAAQDPLAHLMACHRRVEQRLAALARAGEQFTARPEEALTVIMASLGFFAVNGVRHTADEEESVFPRLLPRLDPEEREVLARLEAEHLEAAALHSELNGLAARLADAGAGQAAPVPYLDCVARLSALYARHIAVEDTAVAAMIRRHLAAGDLAEIAAEMKGRRRSLEMVE